MMMIRALAIVGLVGLAACNGPGGNTAPPLTAPQATADPDDLNTPNNLPASTRQGTTVSVETDVVGVTHLPP